MIAMVSFDSCMFFNLSFCIQLFRLCLFGLKVNINTQKSSPPPRFKKLSTPLNTFTKPEAQIIGYIG